MEVVRDLKKFYKLNDMEFTIEEFKQFELSPGAYILLYALVYNDGELMNRIVPISQHKRELQDKGFVKLDEEENIILRQKTLDLQNKLNPEPLFEEFWKGYHQYAKQFYNNFKATDRDPAEKHWKKLTKAQRQLAIDKYKLFIDASVERNIFLKKARTYLSDHNFLDEFEVKQTKSSLNKMI